MSIPDLRAPAAKYRRPLGIACAVMAASAALYALKPRSSGSTNSVAQKNAIVQEGGKLTRRLAVTGTATHLDPETIRYTLDVSNTSDKWAMGYALIAEERWVADSTWNPVPVAPSVVEAAQRAWTDHNAPPPEYALDNVEERQATITSVSGAPNCQSGASVTCANVGPAHHESKVVDVTIFPDAEVTLYVGEDRALTAAEEMAASHTPHQPGVFFIGDTAYPLGSTNGAGTFLFDNVPVPITFEGIHS